MTKDLKQADVQIVPSTKGAGEAIQDAIEPEVKEVSKNAGLIFLKGFKKIIKSGKIGDFFSASLTEGANLQQASGGIDTLFKSSADKVKAYANEAYRTSGQSATSYMESVAGFGASLLESLGGDTEQAAGVANMAMVDMADNANAMGTSIGSIQTAYQEFAKQNYSMLDSLKLGYGDTKEEMQRLLDDAEKLTGVKYDISNLSDVSEAIHVIQENLGITGTAAEDATSTFSGSFSAMKNVAQDVLGNLALGESIEPSMTALAQTTSTFLLDHFIPMVGNILKGLPAAFSTGLGELLSNLFGPELGESIESLLVALGSGFAAFNIVTMPQQLPAAFEAAKKAIIAFNGSLLTNPIALVVAAIAALVAGLVWFFTQTETGQKIWSSFVEWITLAWQNIAQFFIDLWQGISEGASHLWNGVKDVWNGAIEGIKILWYGMVEFFSNLWTSIQELATTAWNLLIQAIMAILQPFIEIFMQYWTAISDSLVQIWEGIKMIFQGAWEFIKSIFMGAILVIIDLLTGNFTQLGVDLGLIWDSIKNAIFLIWEGIKTYFSEVVYAIVSFAMIHFENFKNLLSMLWETVKSVAWGAWEWIRETVSSLIYNLVEGAINAWNSFKDFLSNLWEGLVATATSLWGSLSSSVQNIIDGLVSGAKQAGENLKQSVSDLVSNVTSIFDGLLNIDLFAAGKAILDGFLGGLQSAWNNVTEFVGGIADWIRDNKGPIDYDRKLLIPAGNAIMSGLNQGLEDKFKDVRSTVSGMAGILVDSFGDDGLEAGFTSDVHRSLTNDSLLTHSTSAASQSGLLDRLASVEALLQGILDKDVSVYLDSEKVGQSTYRTHGQIMAREGI